MNEAARLQMLAAIGITPLVPRFVLAGAAPSSQCDTEGLHITEPVAELSGIAASAAVMRAGAVSANTAVVSAAPAFESFSAENASPARRPQVPRIDMDVLAEPAKQESARAQSSAAKADARAESTPRLQVNLIQHHARCFSLLPVYKPEFQIEVEQFLRAVAASLGVASAPLVTQVFRWPFANNAKLDLGPAALREALGGFIQHAAREADSMVMIWGLDLARHLGNDLKQPGEFALSPSLRAVVAHRVQDYFNEPLRKRDLWQQLCVLKPALKTGAA